MFYYGCGLGVATIIGIAAGTRYVERHGWAGLLVVVALTVVLGAVVGWALNGWVTFMQTTRPY